MSDSQQQMTTETALRLLIKPMRRRILRRIDETSDDTTVDQLSARLDGPVSPPTTERRSPENPAVELQHVHLPMLQEADVIAYDAAGGTVQRGREFQVVISLLRTIDDHREDASTRLS